jgi:hypothetical protein
MTSHDFLLMGSWSQTSTAAEREVEGFMRS